ncbi:MAG: hypothetical protein HY063_06545 [Bacteroidetes bacterium]|nr:hypothetical protein [Bacteroidota bacterium]
MNKVVKYYSIVFMALVSFCGCKKKDNDRVPNVYVDIYVYATDPNFSPLNAVNGYQYFSGGSKGIIAFRKSQNEIMAYDRHCTYQVSDGNAASVDASGLIAVDGVCGSKFLLTDGSVNAGPASVPLKRYQTTFDGSVLHIFN